MAGCDIRLERSELIGCAKSSRVDPPAEVFGHLIEAASLWIVGTASTVKA